jgi:hypothetical protein
MLKFITAAFGVVVQIGFVLGVIGSVVVGLGAGNNISHSALLAAAGILATILICGLSATILRISEDLERLKTSVDLAPLRIGDETSSESRVDPYIGSKRSTVAAMPLVSAEECLKRSMFSEYSRDGYTCYSLSNGEHGIKVNGKLHVYADQSEVDAAFKEHGLSGRFTGGFRVVAMQ